MICEEESRKIKYFQIKITKLQFQQNNTIEFQLPPKYYRAIYKKNILNMPIFYLRYSNNERRYFSIFCSIIFA